MNRANEGPSIYVLKGRLYFDPVFRSGAHNLVPKIKMKKTVGETDAEKSWRIAF